MSASNLENLSSEDVCKLPSEELQDRSDMLRRELIHLVIRREPLSDGVAFEFAYTPVMQKKLEDLVAFERNCCSALTWSLARPASDILRLSVRGLTPDSDFFRGLGGGEASSPMRGHVQRIAKAAGFGAVTGFLLCCVIPLGLAAALGTAVAAPFVWLDDPFVIAIAAVLLAVPAWLWMRRQAATVCTDGC